VSPERPPVSGLGHGEHPSGRRRIVIPATCQLEGAPVQAITLGVSKRGGTIVLDPQIPGACVMSLDEDGARKLDTLLSLWLR
jgi:hypothetical protein